MNMSPLQFGAKYGVGTRPTARWVSNPSNTDSSSAALIKQYAEKAGVPVRVLDTDRATLVFTQEDASHPAIQAVLDADAKHDEALDTLGQDPVTVRMRELQREEQILRQPKIKFLTRQSSWLDIVPFPLNQELFGGKGFKAYVKSKFAKRELSAEKLQELKTLEAQYEEKFTTVRRQASKAVFEALGTLLNEHGEDTPWFNRSEFDAELKKGFRDVVTGDYKPEIRNAMDAE